MRALPVLRLSDEMTMTYFPDLTDYSYGMSKNSSAHVKNVGWLSSGVAFPVAVPASDFVDRLWRFCLVSVEQTRGLHECEFCCSREANVAMRNNEEILLGSAEIRVFSGDGKIYAAPNLIFHYVVSHNYSPPEEFIRAVMTALIPPDERYYALLAKFGLDWKKTLSPERTNRSFRFVRTPEGVDRVED